jgi:hypothetical protein
VRAALSGRQANKTMLTPMALFIDVGSLDSGVWYRKLDMICHLHPIQTSRALLDPDIARRQPKGIDQQRILFSPS